MPQITLLVKGNLRPTAGESQEELDKYVPLDYIISFLQSRMPRFGSMSDRVLILQSLVGSGKSTLLVASIYKKFETMQRDVIITQPKILTTIEKAAEMGNNKEHYPYLTLGENIGYTSSAYKQPLNKPGILYCTVGSLSVRLQTNSVEELFNKIGFIIIDEVHERSQELDIALKLVKDMLEANIGNVKCPFVILMSATFDRDKFARFFNVGPENTIYVEGSASQRQIKFLEHNTTDYAQAAVQKVFEIDKSDDRSEPSDIMVFCPGPAEIEEVAKAIEKLDIKHEHAVLQLHSATYTGEMKKMISQPIEEFGKNIVRRVVVCNNVAETGLTMNTLKYVIDSGWDRVGEFNPNYGCKMIINKPVTRSAAIQRSGRIGRVFPGIYYPLFTEAIFKQLQEDKYPSVFTDDISNLLIAIGGTEKIPVMPDPLPLDSVRVAQRKIRQMGFVGLSKIVSNFVRLPLEMLKLILSGYIYGVSIRDLATMATYMTSQIGRPNMAKICNDFGKTPEDRLQLADQMIETLFIDRCIANKLRVSKSATVLEKYCIEIGVNYKSIVKLYESRDGILETLLYLGLPINNVAPTTFQFSEISRIKKCIYSAFKYNRIHRDTDGQWILMGLPRQPMQILEFANDFKLSGEPQHILYAGIMMIDGRRGLKTSLVYPSVMDGWV